MFDKFIRISCLSFDYTPLSYPVNMLHISYACVRLCFSCPAVLFLMMAAKCSKKIHIGTSQCDDQTCCFLQQVQLVFDRFRLEQSSHCEYDSVTIYDGSDDTAPLLRTLCGSSRPGDVTASGNVVSVYFSSDDTITSYGFRIQYRTVLRGNVEWSGNSTDVLTNHRLL